MKALITGASSGIGEALAHLLAEKGYTLILSGRNETQLQQTAQVLKAEYILADLGTQEGRQRLINAIRQEIPDLLINCAGYTYYGDMVTSPIQQQLSLLEVNAVAPIELTLESAKALVAAKKQGVILNVSSVAGEYPAPGMGLYGPAKACLTNFSCTLNTELASKGVHVLVSCPGMVETDFANRAARKPIALDGAPVMSARYAAERIWKQISQCKEKCVFNWFYRLVAYVPVSITKKMLWKKIQKRM